MGQHFIIILDIESEKKAAERVIHLQIQYLIKEALLEQIRIFELKTENQKCADEEKELLGTNEKLMEFKSKSYNFSLKFLTHYVLSIS